MEDNFASKTQIKIIILKITVLVDFTCYCVQECVTGKFLTQRKHKLQSEYWS